MTITDWQAVILLALVTNLIALYAWSKWINRHRRGLRGDIDAARSTLAKAVSEKLAADAKRPEAAEPLGIALTVVAQEAVDRFAKRFEEELLKRAVWDRVTITEIANAAKAARESPP